MPLVAYLKEGATKAAGWHRNEERQARGIQPITPSNLSSTELEPWERQLAVVEVLLLGGGTPYANFQHLAHGWGRRKGFHSVLINDVCERRGEIIRKRKSEIGVPFAVTTGSSTTTVAAPTTTSTSTGAPGPKQQRIQQQIHYTQQTQQQQQQQRQQTPQYHHHQRQQKPQYQQQESNHQTVNNVQSNNHHPHFANSNHQYDRLVPPPQKEQNHHQEHQQPESQGQYYEELQEGYDPNEHQVI